MENVSTHILLILLQICLANCFNISPVPNVIINEPKLATFNAQVRSSYFGFSMILRQKSIIIGAPRAQSTVNSANETGAIYKCTFDPKKCDRYIVHDSNGSKEILQEQEHAWLGAAMDGGSLDDSNLTVCAPRFWFNSLDGVCYTIKNNNNNYDSEQFEKVSSSHYYIHGQQGISIHHIKENNEIIIGAPGIDKGKGSLSLVTGNGSFLLESSNRPNDSYFGYAVSSGYCKCSLKTLYIASSPRYGKVFIFDTKKNIFNNYKMENESFIFEEQTGEYFGYAVVADDFNADGYFDIAISAPFHSHNGKAENGAVYIYEKNSCNERFFSLKLQLMSNSRKNGERFGAAISNIGDINQDGYNDLAVGAPHEDDHGAVYIYFGGKDGIGGKDREKDVKIYRNYDQKITPTENMQHLPKSMFGYSISRGVDIDINNYLDIAISAPNSQIVYIYKTYPIVEVNADIYPEKRAILMEDTLLNLTTCWFIQSKHKVKADINVNTFVKSDYRTNFYDRKPKPFTIKAGLVKVCSNETIQITFNNIAPVDIEMQYSVSNVVPANSEKYCDNCVAVSKNDPTFVKTQIIYKTDCVSEICKADLKLTSKLPYQQMPLLLGTEKTLNFQYAIINEGETAFHTKINFTIGDSVEFLSIASNCKQNEKNVLKCNFQTINKNTTKFINVTVDVTKLEGTELIVKAFVDCLDEQNYLNNHRKDTIELAKLSAIDIVGNSSKNELMLKRKDVSSENITHFYHIRNNGPSTIKQTDILVSIPSVYQNTAAKRANIVPFKNVVIWAQYNNQRYSIEWAQNYTLYYENFMDKKLNNTEHDQISDNTDANGVYYKLLKQTKQRTIFFDCNDRETSLCMLGKFRIRDFISGNEPIMLNITFSVNTIEINEILTETRDVFELLTFATILKSEEARTNVTINNIYPFTKWNKHITKTPWLMLVVSAIVGILLLAIITFIFHKGGFFKREKKQELKELIRRSTLTPTKKDATVDSNCIDDHDYDEIDIEK